VTGVLTLDLSLLVDEFVLYLSIHDLGVDAGFGIEGSKGTLVVFEALLIS